MPNVLIKILKGLGLFILLGLVWYVGAELGFQGKYRQEIAENIQSLQELNRALVEAFKNDYFGGKTAEETYNLFMQALKEEDVDLAVKYFVHDVDRRANYAEKFNKMKEEGGLKKYGEWWPAWGDMTKTETEGRVTAEFYWTQEEATTETMPNGAGGFIEYEVPAGE
ncbi:hypothetical protein KKG36_02465, partial [Patescibacteria group bacterium]|nr:hypothetical protein [Patescibacteria group bacterium]